MTPALISERSALVTMRDGVVLAADILRPVADERVPAILNFGPYHKDGRGGRTSVDSVHRFFAAQGYATVAADLRGLGSSGGVSPGAFAPGEGLDGHDLVEWIARQPWCDGNVGMWGVSYPGITALSTAATQPPHLRAIVPIHATSDLHRGVVSLGGTNSGFWMRADWGPRMLAYNLMPPQWQDAQGRWAQVWAEHLDGNSPWLEAFATHPGFDSFWQQRVVAMDAITCPTFAICGWRDLYADCTPRDYSAIRAPKKLLMGAWKHEFPDTGKQAPAAGLWDMQRWFERWLKGVRNGIEDEAPVSLYVQGRAGFWRSEPDWPPPRTEPLDLLLHSDGGLSRSADDGGASSSDYRYDPTVGMYSLAWDPWTTALDPSLVRDHAADDARSLCFTGPALREPLELGGVAQALLDLAPDVLPLNVVVKLSAVASNGASTLISTGWADLAQQAQAGQRCQVVVPLRATAYRLLPGERLRVSVACADFPRVWPTPMPARLRLFHGASRIRLPVHPIAQREQPRPPWGSLQPEVLASPNDLGGGQTWDITRDLMTDSVRLCATKTERLRIDAQTHLASEHSYDAEVSAARPDLARMSSNTAVHINGAGGRCDLLATSVTTSHATTVNVTIQQDGQPYWQREWRFLQQT